MDPDGTPGGYWRAVTGWLGLTTDMIVHPRVFQFRLRDAVAVRAIAT